MSEKQETGAGEINRDEVGYVVDTLAVNGPRRHGVIVRTDVVSGQPTLIKYYDLNADTKTVMPIDHAMRFLRDSAFVVTDDYGKVLKPVASREQSTHLSIPDGFVLAEYGELSRDALCVRCKLLPGSESIHPKRTSAADMIDFLIANSPKTPVTKKGDEFLDDAAVAAMLENA